MIKTEIIRADISDRNLTLKLSSAAEIIKNGGTVVFPTETVYGLGADGTNEVATSKIYEAKGRPSDNPLIIHIADPCDAEKYAYTSETYYKIAGCFMPGPITVIMPSKDSVPRKTRGGLDTVAVRCPSDPIAHELISLCGVAIAAPSANLSGSPSPTSVSHVINDMDGRVDVIIDGGDCDFGIESTIVRICDDGSLLLLRPGKITPEDLEAHGFRIEIADAVTDKLKEGAAALSPGMKYRHYAPKSPVVLLDGELEKCLTYVANDNKGKIAYIAYSEDIESVKDNLGDIKIFDFGPREDHTYQAHKLFSILREADGDSYDMIYAPLPPLYGIGLALYNRMIRAAAHKIIRL